MNVPSHYEEVNHGIWQLLDGTLPPLVSSVLPFTTDRYLESVHFAEVALAVPPNPIGLQLVNWYASANITAYVGIFEAAKHDIKTFHKAMGYKNTPLAKEESANSQTKAWQYKDPVNANHIYRALRHLRVHYSVPIVVLEGRPHFASSDISYKPRWYLRSIDPSTYRLLKFAPLTDEELCAFNEWVRMETIMDRFGRMLYLIRAKIIETAKLLQTRSKDAV